LEGIYVPYWFFDAYGRADYRGYRGDVYYVNVPAVRYINGRATEVTVRERRIRWTPVAGSVSRAFSHIPVTGFRTLGVSLLQAVAPWPLDTAVALDDAPLTGWKAYTYDTPLSAGHFDAQEMMKERLRWDVMRDIGGDEQRIEAVRNDFSEEAFIQVLVPVWTTSFRYGGKDYRYVINGATGSVAGEHPYSIFKIGLLIAAIATLIALAVWSEHRYGWLERLMSENTVIRSERYEPLGF
jgi:hypothetical protein